jgi:hypothetical protein
VETTAFTHKTVLWAENVARMGDIHVRNFRVQDCGLKYRKIITFGQTQAFM